MSTRLSVWTCVLALVVSLTVIVSGCAAAPTTPDTSKPTTSPSTTPATTPVTTPTTSPSTTPATTPSTAPTSSPSSKPTTNPSAPDSQKNAFQIFVVPEQLNGFAIAKQRCVFLVTLTESSQTGQNAVAISATANQAEVTVELKSIRKGQVSEVTIIPTAASVGKTIDVVITGTIGETKVQKTVSFEVIEGEDDRKEYAVEMRDLFVAWLAKVHPEFKINSSTRWTGTMVSPQWLVVSHYLFFSDEWEMHVEWHIMIPPSDWVRIDLRHRFDESKPSYAFEISSREGKSAPKPIDVPDTIWR